MCEQEKERGYRSNERSSMLFNNWRLFELGSLRGTRSHLHFTRENTVYGPGQSSREPHSAVSHASYFFLLLQFIYFYFFVIHLFIFFFFPPIICEMNLCIANPRRLYTTAIMQMIISDTLLINPKVYTERARVRSGHVGERGVEEIKGEEL